MTILQGLHHLPAFINPVITIGTFDGVHYGHRNLIERICRRAKEVNGQSILITFEPHPRLVLEGQHVKLSLLTTLSEKLSLLSQLPLDYVVVVPFTLEFATMSAAEYVEHFIVNHFHPHTLIIGHDHHFGKNRTGNFSLLERLKSTLGYRLEEIPVQEIEHIAVSSTKIREALMRGEVDAASDFLQRDYSLMGKVIHGKQKGTTIGFPTANLEVGEVHKLIPPIGVYAVKVLLHDKTYQGMMNIGVRPTVSNQNKLSLEVHLIDFDKTIYDEMITVSFVKRLRNEQKFDSLAQLIQQLKLDKQRTIEILNQL